MARRRAQLGEHEHRGIAGAERNARAPGVRASRRGSAIDPSRATRGFLRPRDWPQPAQRMRDLWSDWEALRFAQGMRRVLDRRAQGRTSRGGVGSGAGWVTGWPAMLVRNFLRS